MGDPVVHPAKCAIYHGAQAKSPNKNGHPLPGGH
jgi:hypothetical protein